MKCCYTYALVGFVITCILVVLLTVWLYVSQGALSEIV